MRLAFVFHPRLSTTCAGLAGLLALSVNAHLVSGATPHSHPGDVWGVLLVIALTTGAGWLDRRIRSGPKRSSRKSRGRRPDE